MARGAFARRGRCCLLLVDAYNMVHRAYHASSSNAIWTFAAMLRRTLRETSPTHALVVFESGGDGGRRAQCPSYKANREPLAPALVAIRTQARLLVSGMKLCQTENPEFEADDVIATYALLGAEAGWAVVIASHDKDLAQLVTPDIMLYRSDPRLWGPEVVESNWGVHPALMGDLLALRGDTTDNLKVIPGCGKKKAPHLLAVHGSLEGVLAAAAKGDRSIGPKLRQALIDKADDVRAVRRAVALRRPNPELQLFQLALPEDRSEVAP